MPRGDAIADTTNAEARCTRASDFWVTGGGARVVVRARALRDCVMAKRGLLCLLVMIGFVGPARASVDFDSGSIAGTVTTTNGTIAPQTIVRATPIISTLGSATAFADSTGHYELDFIPVGDYRLDAFYEGTQVASATVTVTKAATTTQNFTFAAGTVSIHVARNSADDLNALLFLQSAEPAPACFAPGATCSGSPMMCNCEIAGRRYFCDPSGACHWELQPFYQAMTGADGFAHKLVPAGLYNVAVGSSTPSSGPMPEMSQSGYIIVHTANDLTVADGIDQFAGDLNYDTATISGTITAGGTPITNVVVRADAGGQNGSITAWVAQDGTYSMELPAGPNYTLTALQDGASSIGSTSNVALAPQETRTIDFSVPGANVSGDVVVDGQPGKSAGVLIQKHAPVSCAAADSCEFNDPMGMCHCTLDGDRFMCMTTPMGPVCQWEMGGLQSTFADATGHFTKFLSPGTYDLRIGSAPVFGPFMMPIQFGQVEVGSATTTIVDGADVSVGVFSYVTGTVAGTATSCGTPLHATFELRNPTGQLTTDQVSGSYTLRAPEGDYTLSARIDGTEFASTPMTIASSSPQTWDTTFDLGEVRGLVLRDGQPATNSQVFLQEQTPASLTCNASCQMYMPTANFCDRCPSGTRFYRCAPQPDSSIHCEWETPRFYQANTRTDGFFTITVAPAIYKLAVLSSSSSDPMGGQTGGILVGTFDVDVAACRQTEVGLASEVPVTGGQNETVSLGDGIVLTFADVAAGNASYVASSTPPPNEPEPAFQSAGLFYDISVPAIAGPVTLCLPYDAEAAGPEDDLHLYHNDATLGWTDITTSIDTVNHVVCGVTNSFSWFAVGIVAAPQSPLSIAGSSSAVVADSTCHGHATLVASGGTGTYEWFQGDVPLGSTATLTVDTLALGSNTIRVVDGSSSATFAVSVVDTSPPSFSVAASPSSLWPPNGKLVAVTPVSTVTDNCDAAPRISFVQATSSTGTPNDMVIDGEALSLRAFRAGSETAGRTYTLEYAATDASGNRSTAATTVTVPHDRR
jgi:hypothetical protein